MMVQVVISNLLICLPSAFCLQASTPYSLESESLRMDCIMSGGVSPTLAINAATNKVLWRSLSLWSLLMMEQTYRATGWPGEQTWETKIRKQAVLHLHLLFMYLFIHLISENRKCQKQDLSLWSESKRKLGSTVSVETSLSFPRLLFFLCFLLVTQELS